MDESERGLLGVDSGEVSGRSPEAGGGGDLQRTGHQDFFLLALSSAQDLYRTLEGFPPLAGRERGRGGADRFDAVEDFSHQS